MKRSRTSRSEPREGYITVLVASSLVTILGFVALSIDVGMLMDARRHEQAAVDGAAFAAAGELYTNHRMTLGYDDSDGGAAAAARAAAAQNGYTHGVNGCTVDVNIPPTTGLFVGQPYYAEVRITYLHHRHFSTIFGSAAVPVRVRAVARGKTHAIGNAIICLDPDDQGALYSNGNGVMTVEGSDVQVNSNHAEAAVISGTNGTMVAPAFDITGSPGTSGTGFIGQINPNSEPIADPLSYLPPPDPSTMPVWASNGYKKSGGKNTIKPGRYVGGISVGGQADLTMEPGIYYMDGGGFSFTGQGSLIGLGVMIYNAPQKSSDTININGQGVVNLSPPTSGPYQGITIFQDRNSTATASVTGNGRTTISGTFYTASAQLHITGNGTSDVIAGQYISNTLRVTGNGNFSVNWSAAATPAVRELRLVE